VYDVSFDELLERLRRRMDDYQTSGVPAGVLSDDALAEAAQIWEIAQPNDDDNLTSEQHRRLSQAHNVLGWLYFLRWNASRAHIDSPDFARALLHLEPLAHHPTAIPEKLHNVIGPRANPKIQADTALHLLSRGMATTDPNLLNAAINLLAACVTTIDDMFLARTGYLSNLSAAYRVLYERTGALEHLHQAIEAGANAVNAAQADDPNRGLFLSNLSAAYQAQYERTGDPEDLRQAIEIGTEAVEAAHIDDPNKVGYRHNLGVSYQAKHKRYGELDDLNRAITLISEAVDTTPIGYPNREFYLSSLGTAYRVRYERTGVLEDLDRAIEIGTEAVKAAPPHVKTRAGCLHNLGNAYRARYERTGVLESLDLAISAAAEAAGATPDDHPDLPTILSNLSNNYRIRYQRSMDVEDLDLAIGVGTEAVAATHADHAGRATSLSIVGNAYRLRYERDRTLPDIDEAISAIAEAVEITPADHVDRASYLLNLSAAHRVRYAGSKEPADLDRALETISAAIEITPADHPLRALYLSTLGDTYQVRVDAGLPGIDRRSLQNLAEQVAHSTAASPLLRVRAGFMVGSLAHSVGEHHIATELLDTAVGLLPAVPPRESNWADQEHSLSIYPGVISEAIAAHCAAHDPVGAVKVAELGRGILLAAHLDSRTALTDLEATHPKLAEQYRTVRAHLSQIADPVTDYLSAAGGQVGNRKRWWADYDTLLTRIREQPGFERFLRPPQLADLQAAATDGAVVLVNAGRRRGDAIIITAEGEPRHVHLPDLTLGEANRHAAALLAATQSGPLVAMLRKQRLLPQILVWLWNAVVRSVLDNLPKSGSAEQPLPRVWWMPTGVLGMLPLHAAGDPERPGALDAVVSSYTPTLRALASSRARPAATVRDQLVVALQHTPGLPDLPGTVAEAMDLHTLHPDTPPLIDKDATVNQVLAALPKTTWAHFACHASIDYIAPSRGGLQLHDASLPIPAISALHLVRAELAYLSACSTAGNAPHHADESLHLASAFQLAGFRHVIASLWPLDDLIAATAARNFYNQLPPTPTAETAAHALHRVILDLRHNYPKRPDLWASLIHNGP
jgi:tetratricopeptide (TPR) repeat protein